MRTYRRTLNGCTSVSKYDSNVPYTPTVVSWAVDRLATVNCTVAKRVTEDVSYAVHSVYDHNLPSALAPLLLRSLQTFDDIT
jgi:hypothetical protein